METGGIAIDRYKPTGLTRVMRAFGASARGLAGALRAEAAFRQEIVFAALAMPLVLWPGHGLERHVLGGSAKDFGPAVVLMCFGLLAVLWLLVLLDR